MTRTSSAAASPTAGSVVNDAPALDIAGLCVEIGVGAGRVRILDEVSMTIDRGRVVGLIGESGSGKSMTALSVLGLLPPAARITAGSITVAGTETVGASRSTLRTVRGGKVGFIFQDPMTTLNPVLTIGFQIKESMRAHKIAEGRQADERAADLLDQMGIANARARLRQYPHEFSGGMRQRIVIAMALACDPELIIADEPTTALDVTIQAQILELVRRLTRERQVACLWITHDIGVAASLCDDVTVMYAGQVVESGSVDTVLTRSRMPYTRALVSALPHVGQEGRGKLPAIPGTPPLPIAVRASCAFAPRCPVAHPECEVSTPELTARTDGVLARCFGTATGGWVE